MSQWDGFFTTLSLYHVHFDTLKVQIWSWSEQASTSQITVQANGGGHLYFQKGDVRKCFSKKQMVMIYIATLTDDHKLRVWMNENGLSAPPCFGFDVRLISFLVVWLVGHQYWDCGVRMEFHAFCTKHMNRIHHQHWEESGQLSPRLSLYLKHAAGD